MATPTTTPTTTRTTTRTTTHGTSRLAVRLAPVLVAVAVTPWVGVLGAGTADASDQPVAGTAACTRAVEASSAVRDARAGVDRAQGADTTAASRLTEASAQLAAAQRALAGVHPGEPGYAGVRQRYEEARSAVATATAAQGSADAALTRARSGLTHARGAAEHELCRPAGSEPTRPLPPGNPGLPRPVPPGNPGLPHPPVGDPCGEVRHDEAVVDGARGDADEAHRTADRAVQTLRLDLEHHAAPDVIERDRARVTATAQAASHADDTLGHARYVLRLAQQRAEQAGAHCDGGGSNGGGSNGGGSGSGSVDPVGDDGSTAVVSGTEVTEVPLGSAQTGEA